MCLNLVLNYRYSTTQRLSMIRGPKATGANLSSKVANHLTSGTTESIRTTTSSYRSGMEAAVQAARCSKPRSKPP